MTDILFPSVTAANNVSDSVAILRAESRKMKTKFEGGIDMETKETVQELSDFIFFLNQALDT